MEKIALRRTSVPGAIAALLALAVAWAAAVANAGIPTVIYVDNASAPGGDGSAADPLDTIQQGVDLAEILGVDTVVVRGGGVPYVEDVMVTNPAGLAIYGDGADIGCAPKNPFSNNGPQPVLEGGLYVDTLPFFKLTGLIVVGGFAGESGVEVLNTDGVEIVGNRVLGTGALALFASGILVRADGIHVGTFDVSCNEVDSNEGLGIAFIGDGFADTEGRIVRNQLGRNMGTALRLSLNGDSRGKLSAFDNVITGNGEFGFGITATTADHAIGRFSIFRNSIEFAGVSGLALSATGDSNGNFSVSKNKVKFSGSVGVAIGAQNDALAAIRFDQNQVVHGADGGISVQSTASGEIAIRLDGNVVAGNSDYGFRFDEAQTGEIVVAGTANNSTLPGNAGNEVESVGNPGGSFVVNGGAVVLPALIP